MIKLGLVGGGPWARNYVKTLNHESFRGVAELSAIASRNHALATFRSWEDMLLNVKLDGLIVACHPRIQPTVATFALSQGIGLILEKPVALSLRETEGLALLARHYKKPVLVDHVHLYAPAFRALLQALKGRKIQEISSAAGNHGPQRSGYDVLWDYGPHEIAMSIAALEATDDRQPITVTQASVASAGGSIQEVSAKLASNGSTIDIFVSNQLTSKTRAFVLRTKDGDQYLYDDGRASKKAWIEPADSSEASLIGYPETSPLAVLLYNFCAAIEVSKMSEVPASAYCRDLDLACQVASVLEQIESKAVQRP